MNSQITKKSTEYKTDKYLVLDLYLYIFEVVCKKQM